MTAKHYLSLALTEPGDGTVLVVRTHDTYRSIVRDDVSAMSRGRRWFNASDAVEDPMTWRTALEYADEVFPLGTALAPTTLPD